jgi:hypothetical protein
MTNPVVVRAVAPLFVLAVRCRLSGQGEILGRICELEESVGSDLAGPPMALRLGFPREGKLDVDLAFPVAEGTQKHGFDARLLPPLSMFSITHDGAVEGGVEGTNLADTRLRLIEFMRGRGVLVGDDPERFIYHRRPSSADALAQRHTIEIQYPYHLPVWLDALAAGTARVAGGDAARRVMAGSEELAESLDGHRVADWVPDAMDRFDQEVPSECDRAAILNACAHHYIEQSGIVLRDAWLNSGRSLRRLVERISAEPVLGSRYWIDETGSQPLLCIERRPARPDAYAKATHPLEKRYQACFCPLVRDAIRDGRRVSRSFCHCSGGWYAQEWEIVFGVRPEVRLLESMLEGADACVFGVVIPEGWL